MAYLERIRKILGDAKRSLPLTLKDLKNVYDDLRDLNTQTGTYKKYVALLTQSGTAAPTAVILENTLGGTPIFTRGGAGDYTITLTGVFLATKTFFIRPPAGGDTWINLGRNDNNSMFLAVYTGGLPGGAGVGTDGVLDNTPIEIRVYP